MNDPLLPTSPSEPPTAPPLAERPAPHLPGAAASAPTDPSLPADTASRPRVRDPRHARVIAGVAAMALVAGIGGTLLATGAGRDAEPIAGGPTPSAPSRRAAPTTTTPGQGLTDVLTDPEHLDERLTEPGTWGGILQSLPGGDDPATDLNRLGRILGESESWLDLATDPANREELGGILDRAAENLDQAADDLGRQLDDAVGNGEDGEG